PRLHRDSRSRRLRRPVLPARRSDRDHRAGSGAPPFGMTAVPRLHPGEMEEATMGKSVTPPNPPSYRCVRLLWMAPIFLTAAAAVIAGGGCCRLFPQGLGVDSTLDDALGPDSVIEPDEAVVVEPAWQANRFCSKVTENGRATALTGPVGGD